ncbi:MAG: hypothetical protein HC923_03950 [Myxococcales bacterium]|nr:hypothetical protein [Myxococcales bacterium]
MHGLENTDVPILNGLDDDPKLVKVYAERFHVALQIGAERLHIPLSATWLSCIWAIQAAPSSRSSP